MCDRRSLSSPVDAAPIRGGAAIAGAALAILVAAAVLAPPVVHQVRHFSLPFNDVGIVVRAIWNLLEHGRMVVYSDGTSNFFEDQHFEPFLFVLVPIVRLFGTMGFIAIITTALAASAAYVYLLAATVCRSPWIGGLAAMVYAANPYTQAIGLSYHVEPFGLLFLLAFAYYAYIGRDRLAWPALLLALTVKEDMWVYAIVIAVMVARPGRLKSSAVFAGAALAYYVVFVAVLWPWLYPTGYRFKDFYATAGQPMTKRQVAVSVIGRWREFPVLLFTGPGLSFQLTLLLVGVLSGWRYLLVSGVMLIWLTYPGGPPRSTFAYYYSYPALLLSFVALPFALRTLRTAGVHLGGRLPEAGRRLLGTALVTTVMLAMIGWNVVSHLPGHAPGPIEEKVDPRVVYGPGSRVNAPIVQALIDRHLRANDDSVLAQYYTVMAIPQRARMYVTYRQADQFLEGKVRPVFVLLDLGAEDPLAKRQTVLTVAASLRQRRAYLPIWDDQNVLLYRRADAPAVP